jgi:tetratricopeptide (TPR) repeat protein
MSQRQSLLEVNRFSTFVNYTPKQTLEKYEELKSYLALHINQLSDLDYFELVELNFYLTLIIGKLGESQISLERLLDKFGDIQSERIAVLKATYLQISHGNNEEAVKYLNLRPVNELLTLKKKISTTKTNKDHETYIRSLNAYLQLAPADVETLAELAETYFKIGHYDKAIFSYEEIILIQPYNYIAHARIAELYHLLYLQGDEKSTSKDRAAANLENLSVSLKYFSRSVELVSNFVRGWSGVFLISKELQKSKKSNDKVDYNKISTLAKSKIEEIISKELASYEDIESAKKILSLTK